MPEDCPHCGAPQKENSKFCSACGKKIKKHPVKKEQSQPTPHEEQKPAFATLPTTQKKRKQLMIGVITIIVIVIVIILILYSQGISNPFIGADSRFVGEWEQNTIGSSLLWKFNNDGTLEKESYDGKMNNVGTWTIKDSQLCLYNSSLCYTYNFSNNGNTLIITRIGEIDNIILTKKDSQGTDKTPNITCTTNSTTNRIIITFIDTNVKWKDIVITTNPIANWQVLDRYNNQLAKISTTSTIVRYITEGDNILILDTTGDVSVTLKYLPTNALLGTWRVNL